SIGEGAFSTNQSLKTVICKAGTPPTLYCQDWSVAPLRTFANTHADLKIYVPDGSVGAYKGFARWSDYQNQIFSIDVMP
ncbi:MAG: hypothetical protein LBI14_03340, partial [Treponema sp.]|nr:hypothetical protein [Treponema sp.]